MKRLTETAEEEGNEVPRSPLRQLPGVHSGRCEEQDDEYYSSSHGRVVVVVFEVGEEVLVITTGGGGVARGIGHGA